MTDLIERRPAPPVVRHPLPLSRERVLATFETLEEAAAPYRLRPDPLMDEFERACETHTDRSVARKAG